MALSIPEIIRQFKADVAEAVSTETITSIAPCLGHPWRDRFLDPAITVHVFLLQILHGNTACTALSRLAGVSFTATAYCAARARLPLALFEELFLALCSALYPETQEAARLWCGHRTWLLDGSNFSMSDTPEL